MNAHIAPPAVLRHPVWYGGTEDIPLPRPPDDYDVEQSDGETVVRLRASNEVVYHGIGPADVVPPSH